MRSTEPLGVRDVLLHVRGLAVAPSFAMGNDWSCGAGCVFYSEWALVVDLLVTSYMAHVQRQYGRCLLYRASFRTTQHHTHRQTDESFLFHDHPYRKGTIEPFEMGRSIVGNPQRHLDNRSGDAAVYYYL